jgi:pSer/pThr/pTyr-binding forkhead associated (FHA) protein
VVHEVRVEARLMSQATDVEDVKEGTCEMPVGEQEAGAGEMIAPPGRPFLIVEGQRHVDLLQPVVSVGRALDNDIILEDPRVSRHHAQLRRRYGRYVLYDMGSSSGTQINEYPVEECVLHSGDVVSFAGVQVIYGEDPPTPIPLPGVEDTPAFS